MDYRHLRGITGIAFAWLVAGGGWAQVDPLEAKAESDLPAPVELEPFVVTGSLIKRTEFEGPSPLLVITREEIERVAGTGLTDLLREIPEATGMAVHEHGTNTDIRAVSALDLRSLGPENTLVLVDGRRLAPNGIPAGATTIVDLNRFPAAMIERIEVLKDGAAAVYGADATAGVVNIVLRRDFTGAEVSARYGNYFATDGAESSWSLVAGGTRGRVRGMIGLTYSNRNAVAARDLPFSASADKTEIWRAIDPVKYASRLQPTPIGVSQFDFRSIFGPYATVFVPSTGQLAHPRNQLTSEAIRNPLTGAISTFLPGTGGLPQGTLGRPPNRASVPFVNNSGRPAAADFVPRQIQAGPLSNSYDFQEFVWNTSATDRRGVTTRLGIELPAQIEFFLAASWVRLETRTQFAPPPVSSFSDNAILVPASNHYNPFGIPVAFTFRPTGIGPRKVRVSSDSLNLLAGLKGLLQYRFEWEFAWMFSRNESRDTQTDLSENAVRAALAKSTPDALNIFGGPGFRNDPATLQSLRFDSTRAGAAETALADLHLTTRELADLPWGPVGASLTFEHRLERFNITNDARSSVLDDVIGASRGFGPTRSRRDVQSLAAELRFPLVRAGARDWFHTVELSTAARFERFSDGYDSGINPFAGLRLRLTDHLLLRASYGEVFRAPSLPQLFGGVLDQYSGGYWDLRRPVELTGNTTDSVGSPRLIRTGGNPLLTPENGTTRQAGFVLDVPGRFLRGLSVDFTYGIIAQNGLIRDGLGLDFIFNNELSGTGDLVIRQPGTETFTNTTGAAIPVLSGPAGAKRLVQPGETVTVPGVITMVLDAAINLSRQEVRYFDYGVRYRRKAGPWGEFALASNWTAYERHVFRRNAGDPAFTSVGRTIPRYRGQSSLSWERERWNANLGLNYTHHYRDLSADGWEVGRHYTFNAGIGYRFSEGSRLKGIRVSLGVENLLDRDPPADASPIGYDPAFIGRPAGRYWFVGVRQTY